MDPSSKLTALASAIIAVAFIVVLSVNAPPYLGGKLLENGLIARVQFSNQSYNAITTVEASYVYYNPTSSPVEVTLPRFYPVYAGYEGEPTLNKPFRLAHNRNVTIQPGEAYRALDFSFPAYAPGTYNVEVNGTSSSVVINPTTLVARLVTDRESYTVDQGGSATLEIYNPGSTPLRYHNWGTSQLITRYVGQPQDEWKMHVVLASYIEAYTTVQPGESHKIRSFSFETPRKGVLALDFNGVVKKVNISQSEK